VNDAPRRLWTRRSARGDTPGVRPSDLSAEGEDLASRLDRAPLAVADAVALVRRVGTLLVVVHAHGIVHGGIEPAAIVLPDEAVESARLFGGSARSPAGRTARALAYLSPEQVRGEPIDTRADVFALGCVLFEAIAGRPAFTGERPAAVLAKVLLDEPPRLSLTRTDVPEALDVILARMLAKSTFDRLPDARAVVAELGGIDLGEATWAAAQATQPEALPERSRRRLYLIMALPAPGADVVQIRGALAEDVAPLGATVEVFADGSAVAALAGRGSALDQAALAARAAIAMRRALPRAAIAALTGTGALDGELPVSDVIDRAARALGTPAEPPAIRVDDDFAGLLDPPFVIGGDAHGLTLLGERPLSEDTRPGAPAGSELELGALEAIFRGAADEEIGRGVIVTGPGGSGKSHLAAALRARVDELCDSVRVLSARGVGSGAETPWSLLSQLVREAASLGEEDPPPTSRRKLRGRVRRHVASKHVERVVDRLAEIAGIPRLDDDARLDPTDVDDAERARALQDFLGHECDAVPVLLVLDDLDRADAQSLDAVGALLEALGERRLMVLALARPELDARFPRLWAEHAPARIDLDPRADA
jgi:eukaryotic-like serine/threonine-protein kinase